MSKLLAALFLLSSFSNLHAQEQEAAGTFRAGPTLAVQEASLKDGFKLSEKAKEVIGVKVKSLGARPFNVPTSALVFHGDKVGVYRFRDGWFKLIEVQRSGSSVSSSELRENDQIAIQGVALLRVSEMDAFGGEE